MSVSTDIPIELLTDNGGVSQRLKTEDAHTHFFAGREFRTFYEGSIPAGATIWLKATTLQDVIVHGLGLQVDDGYVRLTSWSGSTETTPFNTSLPVFSANRMDRRPQPYYTPTTTFSSGGTATGGTQTDVLIVKTSGNSNQSSTNESYVPGDRGVPAAVFYFKLENLGNATAAVLVKARWQELG